MATAVCSVKRGNREVGDAADLSDNLEDVDEEDGSSFPEGAGPSHVPPAPAERGIKSLQFKRCATHYKPNRAPHHPQKHKQDDDKDAGSRPEGVGPSHVPPSPAKPPAKRPGRPAKTMKFRCKICAFRAYRKSGMALHLKKHKRDCHSAGRLGQPSATGAGVTSKELRMCCNECPFVTTCMPTLLGHTIMHARARNGEREADTRRWQATGGIDPSLFEPIVEIPDCVTHGKDP